MRKITVKKCSCGHESCGTHYLEGIGTFYNGSGFSKSEAQLIARLLNGTGKGEICICAAVIAENGNIYRGHRHSDCIQAILNRNLKPKKEPEAQGFITSKNRFVTREEGRKLQDKAGIKSADKHDNYQYKGKTLFSEDLY